MISCSLWKKGASHLLSAFSLAFFASQAMAQATAVPSVSTQAAPSTAQPAVPVPQTPEFAPDIEAEKIVFATDVSSHVPVGVADVFSAGVQTVYCWNELYLTHVPAEIRHEWFWNDKKINESIFHLRNNRTRVWSRRKVHPGQWRVEISDARSGRLIAVGAFVVRKS